MVAWTPAVMVGLWALARLLGLEDGYPWVALMAYTPEVLPVALLSLLLALLLRQWVPATVAGVALAILVGVIAPRAIGGPDDVEGRSLRVMSANVFRGKADAKELVDLIRERGVELLTVQEITPEFARRFREAGGEEILPHSALALREDTIGSGVYSRYPTRNLHPGSFYFTQTRATIRVGPGLRLGVLAAHPSLPGSDGQTREWEAALDGMPDPSPTGPIRLLLGDFNATLDHDEFRNLLDRGYADAGEQLGEGLAATWPTAFRPWRLRFLPVTIDHLLYDSDRVGVRDYEVLELRGSDHRPVYAELVLSAS